MAHPFFDSLRYPWHRPEAAELHRILTDAEPNPSGIESLYLRCAPGLDRLALNVRPAAIWKEALENLAARKGALRRFCQLVQAEARFQHDTVQQAVQAVVEARPDAALDDIPAVVASRGAAAPHQHALLVAEAQRTDLHGLLCQVEMSENQWWQCYLDSLPQPPRPALETIQVPTLHNIVSDLCARPLQNPGKRLPLFDFIERVALATQDDNHTLSAELRHWVDQTIPTLSIGLDAGDVAQARLSIRPAAHSQGQTGLPPAGTEPSSERATTYLGIELIPDLHNRNRDKQKQYRVEITLWNGRTQRAESWYPDPSKDPQKDNGAPEAMGDNSPLTVTEIETLLDRLLSDERYISQIPQETELALEFIVPFELLSAEVAHWQKMGARPRGSTYGMNHPLVMRLHNRLTLPAYDRLTLFPIWQERWRQFIQLASKGVCDHVRWLHAEEELAHQDPVALTLQLSDEERVICLGLETPAQNNEIFDLLIDAAVPVALWLDPRAGEIEPAPSLRQALPEIAGNQKLNDLPRLIRQARRAAARNRTHIGHHLVLLWDSPTRIPPKYEKEHKLQ